jgi:hypothetical protein
MGSAAHNLRLKAAIAVLGCVVVGGCSLIGAPGDVTAERTAPVSVNRANKGDRLPSVAVAKSFLKGTPSTAASSRPRQLPLGCDAAFSPIADPTRAGIYKRCAA